VISQQQSSVDHLGNQALFCDLIRRTQNLSLVQCDSTSENVKNILIARKVGAFGAAAFAAATASLPERAGNGATVQVRGRPIPWNPSLFHLLFLLVKGILYVYYVERCRAQLRGRGG